MNCRGPPELRKSRVGDRGMRQQAFYLAKDIEVLFDELYASKMGCVKVDVAFALQRAHEIVDSTKGVRNRFLSHGRMERSVNRVGTAKPKRADVE